MHGSARGPIQTEFFEGGKSNGSMSWLNWGEGGCTPRKTSRYGQPPHTIEHSEMKQIRKMRRLSAICGMFQPTFLPFLGGRGEAKVLPPPPPPIDPPLAAWHQRTS